MCLVRRRKKYSLVDCEENIVREVLEGRSIETLHVKLDDDNISSSSPSDGSDNAELPGLSENAEWIRKNFKKPLRLAMRDILARKPSDPIDFLASWLLHYRKVQETSKLRRKRDRELMEERRRIQRLLSESSSEIEEHAGIERTDSDEKSYEGDEAIEDAAFENYPE